MRIQLTLALLFLVAVQCRVHIRELSMPEIRRSRGWIFLDRMSFDAGNAVIKLTLRIETPTETRRDLLPLELVLIPDAGWAEQQAFQCEKAGPIGDNIVLSIDIRKEENYYAAISHEMTVREPTNYHFVLRDCQKILANEYFRKQTRLLVNLELNNSGAGHGSDQSMSKFMLPLLLVMCAVMTYYSKEPKHQEIGQERDWAKFILFITLAINFVALLFYYVGFLLYLANGQHSGFFDFMYLVFHSISQSVLTSLLIFIAYGWTITFTKDAEFDLYIPLIAMLGIINLILTLLGKINDGDSDKYHMYDTLPSYMLVFFRVVTVLIFVIGLVKLCFYDCKKSRNKQIISFLANFGFMGAIYFLSLPAIMLMANFLPFASRKQIVFFSVECIKNSVNLILTWMVSSKKSGYKNIRQSGQSFFQSDNKLL